MTPISDKLIFIFKVFIRVLMFSGNISLVNIWNLVAFNDFSKNILDLSV